MNCDVKIGLEIHVQLTELKTKLFCSCPSNYRGKTPNSVVCPVCLGLPGALPVVNDRAIDFAVMIALALKSKINREIVFYRKHYFYPDMSKNFQITQFEGGGGAPIAVGGELLFDWEGSSYRVRIRRISLEEDPAKLTYPTGSIITSPYTLVDYNRSGIALAEIVTEPDIRSPRMARVFLAKLRSIIEHLGVADLSLEGSMRVDANVSIKGHPRIEVKNIGSIKEVERALAYEIVRQKEALKKGLHVKMETRHWDSTRGVTVPLRVKEEEQDYRYFPEPDLPPVIITDDRITRLKTLMPELPEERAKRFVREYGVPDTEAIVIVSSKPLADFFEEAVKYYRNPKRIANMLVNDVLRWLNERDIEIEESKMKPQHLAELLELVDEKTISIKIAKRILPKVIMEGISPREIVRREKVTVLSEEDYIAEIVEEVFKQNPKAVSDALREEKAIHFLVGQVMRVTRGRADPNLTIEIIKKRLQSLKGGVR